jgi:hypothetical protein
MRFIASAIIKEIERRERGCDEQFQVEVVVWLGSH